VARPLPWIRLYTNWLLNPKIAMLPTALQLHWLKLISLAGQRGGALPEELEEVAFTLRCPVNAIRSMLAQLETARLFEKRDGRWVPHDYDDWQSPSDSSTDRARKCRSLQRVGAVAATLPPTVSTTEQPGVAVAGNPSVTAAALRDKTRQDETRGEKTFSAPRSQPRTEPTASEARPLHGAFDAFIANWPEPEKIDEAAGVWGDLVDDGEITGEELPKVMAGLEAFKISETWLKEGGKYKAFPANWLRGKQWRDRPKVAESAKAKEIAERPWTGRNANEEFKGFKRA
jgi:hypothetical protein